MRMNQKLLRMKMIPKPVKKKVETFTELKLTVQEQDVTLEQLVEVAIKKVR